MVKLIANKIIENNRLFVVDTENTNNYSFINNFKVNENDNIVLFFSNNSKSITIQTFDEILKCGAKILTQNVNVGGKNALDFQLVAFITEKTIRGNFSEIHVISNDTGFNSDLRTVYIQIFTLFKFDKNLKKYNRKTTLFIVK